MTIDILTLDGALAELRRLEATLDRIHERIHQVSPYQPDMVARDIRELLADAIECEACCDAN